MIFGFITFLSAITISAVAIYYSVAGLAAIFAAAVIPIIIMGVSLEIGKLVTAVWLHRYWRQATWWLRTYLSVAVVVLMFITSMGIFGFLSKAHIEQTSLSQEQVALIDTLNDKETRSQAKIDRWRGELDRLVKGEDVRVDSLIEKEQEGLDKIYARIKEAKDAFRADAKFEIEQQQLRIKQGQDRRDAEIAAAEKKFEGSLGGTKAYEDAVKKAKDNELSVASRAQAEILKINTQLDTDLKAIDAKYAKDVADINKRINGLRNEASNKTQDIEGRITDLEGWIEGEQKVIDVVREEKFGYEKQYRKLEAEVGPIKYIAEFIYGEQADTNLLEAAVRWVIIIIIFVFDPLAVLLLIASQYTFNWNRQEMVGGLPPKPNPDPDPENKSEEIDDDELVQSEETQEEVLPTTEPRAEAEKVEPTLSKKNTDQYLLWPDVDPSPQKDVTEEVNTQESVDPNQLELDFEERLENETEEEYNKRIWKSQNPGLTINAVKKLYDTGTLDQLPWEKNKEVDTTINSMKEEGDWPKIQDDLEAWNEWVEKANEEAEKNPENPNKTQYTEVIEPQGFNQNEEQKDDSVWSKINQARNNINLEKIKELEITEEQYRNASQRHIIKLIERLKAGIITVDELSNVDANKINDMLKREKN
jgi:hypothetical protein